MDCAILAHRHGHRGLSKAIVLQTAFNQRLQQGQDLRIVDRDCLSLSAISRAQQCVPGHPPHARLTTRYTSINRVGDTDFPYVPPLFVAGF